jgi:hypothetical protein
MERASGGASVVVDSKLPQSKIDIKTPLQAVAVRVTLHKTITVCSIYLPPNSNVTKEQLEDLIKQLPEPFILLGDLNGHSPLWGCSSLNNRGKIIEDCIGKNDLCLLNDKSFTYLHPATGHYSSLDLSICSPTLFLDYEFKVHDDLCGSDHFPTFLTSVTPVTSGQIPRWKFSKANWEKFNALCHSKLYPDRFKDLDDPISEFSTILL